MRLIVVVMSLVLMSISSWAGTFRDDFEDGDWDGWTAVATLTWDTNVADRVSVVDGVLRLDHYDTPGYTLALSIDEDWRDYSFSADMRLVKTEPGAPGLGGGISSRVEALDSYGSYYIHGAISSWYAACEAKSKVSSDVWLIALPGNPWIGEWHRLRIDSVGNDISYYVDGELQHQAKDDLHSSGGVNLYAYNAIVEFDNVIITGDDVPDGGPGGYTNIQAKVRLATNWGKLKR